MVPPQFAANAASTVQTDLQRGIGRTRSPLLAVQEDPSERNSARPYTLPCSNRQVSEEMGSRVLGFVIGFFIVTSLSLFTVKVNACFGKNSTEQKKLLCPLSGGC